MIGAARELCKGGGGWGGASLGAHFQITVTLEALGVII